MEEGEESQLTFSGDPDATHWGYIARDLLVQGEGNKLILSDLPYKPAYKLKNQSLEINTLIMLGNVQGTVSSLSLQSRLLSEIIATRIDLFHLLQYEGNPISIEFIIQSLQPHRHEQITFITLYEKAVQLVTSDSWILSVQSLQQLHALLYGDSSGLRKSDIRGAPDCNQIPLYIANMISFANDYDLSFAAKAALCQFHLHLIVPFEKGNLIIGHLLFVHLMAIFGREYGMQNNVTISCLLWSRPLYKNFQSFYSLIKSRGSIENWLEFCFNLVTEVQIASTDLILRVNDIVTQTEGDDVNRSVTDGITSLVLDVLAVNN